MSSFYAVIPATVRYDNKLSSGAKLLYGEITSLCNSVGYCWANDKYFAQFFGSSSESGNVSTRTIRRWIKSLIDGGYVERVLVYDKQGGLRGRRLYLAGTVQNLVQYPMDNNVQRDRTMVSSGMDNDVHHNEIRGIMQEIDGVIDTCVDDKKINKKEKCAGARVSDCTDEVFVLEENQQAYEALNDAIDQCFDAGANDMMTQDDFVAMLKTVSYISSELALKTSVNIRGSDIRSSEIMQVIANALIRGRDDHTILSTIRRVCSGANSGKIRNQTAYLISAIWTNLHLSA